MRSGTAWRTAASRYSSPIASPGPGPACAGRSALLAALDGDDTPFDVRAHALVASGWAADRADRREDAVRLYRQALVHLDTRPEYNHQLTIGPVRSWAAAGLKAPRTAGPPQETPNLQMVA